jgi:DNA-binding CsgD family transcriptional regulator
MLRDRRDESAVIGRLLEDARVGRSGALLVRGEAGIGKTALLENVIASASGLTLLRAAGVESERELAFGALHQLCGPVLDRLDRLPGPQRDALATTFGLSAGAVPDRLLVSLATLSLLSEVAEDRPLLGLIDDAQWLDRASAQALVFVARRLLAESVVMLFVAREPSDAFTGVPELVVQGLQDADARALLASAIPGRLDERVADQLLSETRGNPLALLELPRELSPAQLAGGFGLPGAVSVPGRIEERFAQRFRALPEDAQRLLVVAGADPTGDPALVWRAAERLSLTSVALEAVEAAGLLEIGARVRFRHPLARSAVYRAAPPEERRRAHRALAGATDAEVDPDRRAWHLAEATAAPDERVAADLARAANRAQARGGLAAAAAFLERATTLTVEPRRRAERALAAAQAKYEAGALDDALTLLAEVSAHNDLQSAHVDLLRAQIAFAARRGSDAPPLLLKAARALEAVDAELARATYLEAFVAARFAGRLARGTGVLEVSELALAGPPCPPQPRPHDLLLEGLATVATEGYAMGASMLKQALRAFRRETVLRPQDARWLGLACWAAADLWDEETWRLLATRELERARETGALTAVPLALSQLSYIHITSGELATAASLLDEIRAAADATGTPAQPYIALQIAALRGREAEFLELVDTTVKEAVPRGEGFAVFVTEHISALLYNGLGRYDAATTALRRHAVDPFYTDGSVGTMVELIEAAVRSGKPRLAERALGRLAEATQASGTDWALGLEARSRALVSDGEAADELYREAIERLGRTHQRVQLSRAHLVYGEWLRRERRRADAREQLRIAFSQFTDMGTEAFAGRAERELSASGEHVRRHSVETRDDLTVQEAQVARLAGDGLSNAEIGARLFISRHTVAYHLRKVFTKLNVSSRNQLAGAIGERVEAEPV